MVFTREKKMIWRPIRTAIDVFSDARKMICQVRSHSCVWVSRQNSCLLQALAACSVPYSAASQTFNEKSFSRGVFLVKKSEKYRGNWSRIVSFVSLSMKKTVASWQKDSGRGKIERDVSLSCPFYQSYFVFYWYSHRTFWEGEEEKGRPDTKPLSKSCDTSKIWMWQWLDNTQYPMTSPTTSKYE